jgi:CheY-like chemotaxis protein
MDIHMPEMDGVEATQRIRSDRMNLNQKTPIVALTAAALLEEKK